MADVVSTPILTDNQNKSELCSGDSDYGSQHANGSFPMEVEEANHVKQEPALGSFEAALAAAAAGATHRKKENAPPPKKVKEEYSDDDDIPWAERMAKEKKEKPVEKKKDKKRKGGSDSEDEYKPEVSDEDDVPWSQRLKKESVPSAKKKPKIEADSDFEEKKPKKGKKNKKHESDSEEDYTESKKSSKKEVKKENGEPTQRRKKKEEEPEDVWEWWKEEKKPAGVKWNSLHHKGPLFAPPYERLPEHVKFKYDGKVVLLSEEAEEVATFYAKMLDHEYTTKDAFNKNFFRDWRKVMTPAERELITDLTKCDFRQMDVYFKEQSEIRKSMSKEEKAKIKEAKEAEAKIYGVAYIDGHKQKVGNFRIEPPGLFRGRGGHPKMGMLKKRIRPEDVIINCSKDSEIPVAPNGRKWKEVRHDNTVTWLVSWTENVLGQNKYIMLNPSSKIKGEKDYEKYETARRLKTRIDDIRAVYTADWKSKEMRVRQRAVALYFIDKLALRAGNEKDVDEAADTVGCCSLRCEHIKLYEKLDDKEYVVEFDFLGKDSIRYFNQVPVEKRVFKNLQLFMDNKEPGDDLFDRLDTASLNEHLRSLMDGLTVKVFRTYNASITLQQQLAKLTNPDDNVHQKMLSYNRANRMVAILCNHQRAVPKGHEKAMENLEQKIKDKKRELKEAKAELEKARGAAKEKARKKVDRLKEQLKKLKISRTDRDENKQIALGTSKLNYLDPRISVAWCKKFNVPIEKVFNKTLREKFRWAIDMTMSSDEEYIF
ncbi:Eukaryotic DNA topoisomerase I, DNA binding protein [Ostertagia ostertagi]